MKLGTGSKQTRAPLVPADACANAAKAGVEHLEPCITWGEVELLLVP
jgi:hypothetical protein